MSIFGSSVNDSFFLPEENRQEGVIATTAQVEPSPEEGQEGDIEEIAQGNGDIVEPSNEDTSTNTTETLYAGKFKSVEELEKAYQNLQPTYTKTSQELQRLRKEATQPMQQNTPQPSQNLANLQNEYPQVVNTLIDEVYKRVHSEVVTPLQQRLEAQNDMTEQMYLENELAKMSTKHADFKEVAPKMMEILDQKRALMGLPDYLDVAYTLAQKEVNDAKMAKQVSNARNEAYKNRDIKVVNSTNIPVAKHQPSQGTISVSDSILNDILSLSQTKKSIFQK